MKNGPYILIKVPASYPGRLYRKNYAYEHHFVYWLHHSITIKPGEVIHHKNHIKTDNRIENLELITRSLHAKHHSRPITYINLDCFKCKKTFSRQKRHVAYKMKTQTRFFCSRSCQISVASREHWEKFRSA